jgi:Carboxypeptidase regulatory-like domain
MLRAARLSAISFVLAISGIPVQSAFALIEGGEGNEPVHDPGWPAGAAAVFNQPTRIAWWEGPPFGGGQWHGEFRGSAKELNAALEGFAKIGADTKRLTLHDGIGRSFWLNPNNEAAKADAAKIDWVFVVWQPDSWERLRKMPASLRPGDVNNDKTESPVEIEVYTGGGIRWADVKVPPGIEIFDDRMEAHGFTLNDGTVLEGNVTDLANKPLAARVELQLIEPQPKGGYRYTVAKHLTTDANGHWVLTKAPAGWYQVVALADGYVPRVIGYAKYDGQPGWHSYEGQLSPVAAVSGRVADEAGRPLSEVEVRLYDVACNDKEYKSSDDYKTTTDAGGRFQFDLVPTGKARVVVHKAGYCRPGLGEMIDTPAKDADVTMKQSGQIHVVVDFGEAKRPKEYIVELTPEGGNVVGSWGGSSQINEKNEVSFKDAPPGRYELVGHPNPTSEKEKTKAITVDLKGGATEDVTITANKSRAK